MTASLQEQESQGDGGLQTGTPLFAAISVLDGGLHTVSTELESLFNVMLYIVRGGHLPWAHFQKEDVNHISLRMGSVLSEGHFERAMLAGVGQEFWPALKALRSLFFPHGECRRDVSCQEFLDAL